MTAAQFVEVLRTINCMKPNELHKLFGESLGIHYEAKFKVTYGGDIAKFLMYLDTEAAETLIKYAKEKGQ